MIDDLLFDCPDTNYMVDAEGNRIEPEKPKIYDIVFCCDELKKLYSDVDLEIKRNIDGVELWIKKRWGDMGGYYDYRYCQFCGKKMKIKERKE